MKVFVRKAPRFPDLSLEVGIARVPGYRHLFDLTVRAWGDVRIRDAWQSEFDRWCAIHGQCPVFVRGNVRTERTQAKVVLAGDLPVVDFVTQWVGLEALEIGGERESRISQLETQIAILRKQNAELTRFVSRTQPPRSVSGGG